MIDQTPWSRFVLLNIRTDSYTSSYIIYLYIPKDIHLNVRFWQLQRHCLHNKFARSRTTRLLSMADELINYKLQLQQVEAALTNSPDDPELMKLKTDLEEVIELTAELVRTQTQPKKEVVQTKKESSYQPDILPSVAKTKGEWKSGDRCLAQLADDGKFYEGTIETIDGEAVAVLIDGQKAAAVTTLDFIKDLPRTHPNEMKHKKQPVAKYREYQKKRKLAKQQRFKQLEEEREVEKNKWLAFATKGVKKGIPKKSIFASPDNVNGRVGIGTCGLGGKGMTEFPTAEKRKK